MARECSHVGRILDVEPELPKAIRYDRALAYEQTGQSAKARADLKRLFAIDPDYLDVKVRLAGLAPPATEPD